MEPSSRATTWGSSSSGGTQKLRRQIEISSCKKSCGRCQGPFSITSTRAPASPTDTTGWPDYRARLSVIGSKALGAALLGERGEGGALLAGLLMACCGQVVQSSLVVMADVPALFWATLSAVSLGEHVRRAARETLSQFREPSWLPAYLSLDFD